MHCRLERLVVLAFTCLSLLRSYRYLHVLSRATIQVEEATRIC